MDRESRIRVALVAFLTLGVMGGVVAAALRHKPPADDPLQVATSGDAAHARGGPSGDARAELPPECRPDAANPAKLVFDLPGGNRLDLGPVKQGGVVERDVVVRNTGRGVLCVPLEPHTGCGCVKATWVGETRILPGGTGLVRIRLDTKGKEGIVEKDVTIYTNEPGRKEAVFSVRCEVRLGILVAQTSNVTLGSVVFFGRHAPGKPGTVVIRLKSPKDDPVWAVTNVEGTKTKFTWSAAPVEENDPLFRHVDVTVTHPGSPQLDLNDESLKITTTHPDRPEIVLQSQLLVARRYYTSPPNVRFGFVGGTAVAAPRVVTVLPGEEGTSFTVTKAEIKGQGFTAGAPADHGREGWQVEVRYDERKRGKGPLDATLVLHFDDAEIPTLEVPIRADVRE